MYTDSSINKKQFLRYINAANSISAALQTRNKNGRVYGEKYDETLKDDFKKFLLYRTMNLWIDKKELKKEIYTFYLKDNWL